MHMICAQVPLFNPTFFLFRQSSEHLSQIWPETFIQRISPTLRDKYYVIFALPFRVA